MKLMNAFGCVARNSDGFARRQAEPAPVGPIKNAKFKINNETPADCGTSDTIKHNKTR
jgi:hypothetical protein